VPWLLQPPKQFHQLEIKKKKCHPLSIMTVYFLISPAAWTTSPRVAVMLFSDLVSTSPEEVKINYSLRNKKGK